VIRKTLQHGAVTTYQVYLLHQNAPKPFDGRVLRSNRLPSRGGPGEKKGRERKAGKEAGRIATQFLNVAVLAIERMICSWEGRA